MSGLERRPGHGEAGGPAIELQGVSRHYHLGDHTVTALTDIDLDVRAGSLVALHGRSGSGKTTLLNIIGGLDRPDSGTVMVGGRDLAHLDEASLVEVRRHRVGFVFQAFGLIPILNADENVEIPLRLAGAEPAERTERAGRLLELVGLGDRRRHRPHELSGGEQQRVAIARALANRPRILLADEPTGQLDSTTGRTIMHMIHGLVRSEDITAIVATHDPALIDIADRVLELRDGRIVGSA